MEVTSAGTTAPLSGLCDFKGLFTLSGGRQAVLFADGATGFLASAATSGGAWTAPAILGGNITATAVAAADVIADALHVWLMVGQQLRVYHFTWNDGASVWTPASYTLALTFPSGMTISNFDAAYDGTLWRVAFIETLSGSSILYTYSPGPTGAWGGYTSSSTYDWGGPSEPILYRVSGAMHYLIGFSVALGSYVALVGADTNAIIYSPYPEVIYTPGGAEAPLVAFMELDGLPAVILQDGGSLLYAKRTGLNAWSTPVVIAQAASDPPAVTRDTASGHLFVTFASALTSQLSMVSRLAGWDAAVPINGADTTTQRYPVAMPALQAAGVVLTYTSNATAVETITVPTGGQPQAPSLLKPVSATPGLTPTMLASYNNLNPSDPLGSAQIQCLRVSDAVVMWDSGITAIPESVVYGTVGAAATALSYDVAYQWRRRDADTISNGGAGTLSAWSPYLTFTPRQGGTVVILSVTSDGVETDSSPVTIGVPALAIATSWTQPSAHAAASYTVTLYGTDDLTVIDSTTVPLAVSLASGADKTLSWTPVMENGTTYHLGVAYTDAVTQVVTESAHWTIITDWVPADPPTDLLVTPDPAGSRILLSLSPSAGTQSVMIEMQQVNQSGTAKPWMTQWTPADGMTDALYLYPSPKFTYNYRVTAYNGAGVPSDPVVVAGVLPLLGGRMGGCSIMDPDDHTSVILLGALQDWSSLKWQDVEDVAHVVPLGADKEVSSFGITDFQVVTQAWFLPPLWRGGGAVLYAQDQYEALERLRRLRKPLLYRDLRGRNLMATLENMWPQEDPSGGMLVTMDVREKRGTRLPVVSLS